jgi:hypothetical protein
MGISTDGILAFGFDLGLEGEKPEFLGDHEDIDEMVTAEAGLTAPEHRDYERDWREYWKAKKAALAACPIELIEHCSGEYPMYIIAVRGTGGYARRGYAQKVDTSPPAPEKIEAARAWCEAHGIEWQEPCWLLASFYST